MCLVGLPGGRRATPAACGAATNRSITPAGRKPHRNDADARVRVSRRDGGVRRGQPKPLVDGVGRVHPLARRVGSFVAQAKVVPVPKRQQEVAPRRDSDARTVPDLGP